MSYQTSNSVYGQNVSLRKSPQKYSYPSQSYNQSYNQSTIRSPFPQGLQNLTNTCYISAVLQNLFLILNEKDLPIKYQSQQQITHLLFKLKKTKDVDDYKRLKEALDDRIEIVQGWDQQDAHQFLIELIQQLRKQNSQPLNAGKVNLAYRENLNMPKNWQIFKDEMKKLQNSKVIPIFYGQMLRRFICNYNPKHVKYNFQRYSNISLSFTPRQNISRYSYGDKPLHAYEMICQFLGKESIDDLNCEQCKTKRKFTKETALYSLPKVLILHISRFIKGYYDNQKNSRQVVFDEILALVQEGSTQKIVYKLIGVIHHVGTLNRGHYYADIKVNNEWFEMNDDKVSKTVIQPLHNVSKTVYLLIYQKS